MRPRSAVRRLAATVALATVTACAGPALELRRRELARELERAASPAPASASEDPFPGATQLERQALVQAVLRRNPTLESARLAWRAALARYPQQTALEDPTLGAMLAPGALGSDAVHGGYRLELRQGIPFPGKLALRGEAALAEAEAASHDYGAARLRLATMASLLFDESYLAARALEINAEHLRLLEEFQRIATARYEAGLASAQDPLQAESELAELLHREVELQRRQNVAAAQINALLHRSPELPLPPPPPSLAQSALDRGTQVTPASAALLERALAARPDLLAADSRVQAREASLALARREFLPDFELQGVWDTYWQEPELRPSVGLAINIPLQIARRRAAVEEASAELERARSEEQRVTDEVRLGVVTALEDLREAEHLLELSRDRLLPPARDRVAAARAAFESGQESFLVLIDAERGLRSAQLGYEEALTNLLQRRAELDRATGRLPAFLEGDEK